MRMLVVAILLLSLLPISLAAPASAASGPITLMVNGTLVPCDVPPQLVAGRTLVPIRAIAQALGLDVKWNQDAAAATISQAGQTFVIPPLCPGRPVHLVINGVECFPDVPPQMIGGRVMVPIRFAAEAFGNQVRWEAAANQVLITPSATPVYSSGHRIAVRITAGQDGVGAGQTGSAAGVAEFYDRQTGDKFVPRGANYVRLAPHAGIRDPYHSTFDAGLYDAARAEEALASMAALGYNTARVFIDQTDVVDASGRLSPTYLGNVADFLGRAKAHGIYVILATDFVPSRGYAERYPWSAEIAGANAPFMTASGIAIEGQYWQDLIRGLQAQGAPLDAILAYSLRNEAFMIEDGGPFNLGRPVTTANGKTYDMSDRAAWRAALEDNLVNWFDQTRAAIKEVDPTALVTCGFFQPKEPNPLREASDNRIDYTKKMIWESTADFIDLHAYSEVGGDLGDLMDQYLENYEVGDCRLKPIILGEAGVAKRDGDVRPLEEAAQALYDWWHLTASAGFDGWLLWTWDTAEQPLFATATEQGGLIARTVAPVNQPDPAGPSSAAAINVARGATVTASRSDSKGTAGINDGNIDPQTGSWCANAPPPQWVCIDLGGLRLVSAVYLLTKQSPACETVHVLEGQTANGEWKRLNVFSGPTSDPQRLSWVAETPEEVKAIRVTTTQSLSWVAWREIWVFAVDQP